MTDKELLELAATAFLPTEHSTNAAYMRGFFSNWNPLADDGDALRLAMALHINLEFESWEVVANTYIDPGATAIENITTGYGIEEATRRAIVRAAATIAKLGADKEEQTTGSASPSR